MLTNSLTIQILIGIFFFALWGSFMGASYFRLLKRYAPKDAQELSLWFGRSHCYACQEKLGWLQMIPVSSWLFQRGKCSHCETKISVLYPLIELSTIILFFIHFYVLGDFGHAFFITLILSTLCVMAMIDLKYFILPDDLQLILFISWFFSLLRSQFTPDFFTPFIEGMVGLVFTAGLLLGLRAFFLYARKVDAIGFGDIKLAGIAGLWLGIWYTPWMLLIGSVGTLIFVGATTLIKKDFSMRTQIPFGPGLALGFYVTFLVKIIIN